MVHFGLIGARLGHSLSPQIHQLIFKELGVEGTYDLLEIPPKNYMRACMNCVVNTAESM